uniref:Potassium channel subfamily K member 9 n=3 Tax=Lygus hesperus TaxID=30085 RepID=A0A146LTW2_LYGHE
MRQSRSRFRESVRSQESYSSAGSDREHDPKEKIKNCCRKVVAFMCTQVGVGGLIVGYAVVGAFGFIQIESREERPELEQVEGMRRNCAIYLWDVMQTENVFNHSRWSRKANVILKDFQQGVAGAVKRGYDGRTVTESWSFPAALMFCLSVFTMIGYGNLVPRTNIGKAATIVYAIFGVPLYVLYFMNMGKVLASVFRWFYTKMSNCCTSSHKKEMMPRKVIVPSTACLWVLGAYIATGTIMFAEWEKWDYLDSTYFCVTSLCKIGFGDLVPGANISESKSGHQTKLVINFVYLLVGMGVIAMCYNLMREVVRLKMHELKRDILVCFEDIRLRLVACYARRHSPER